MKSSIRYILLQLQVFIPILAGAAAKTGDYGEQVTGYTPNGAVTGIRRWGAVMNSAGYGLIDDLCLEYEGNRLVRVSDDAPEINVNGAMDFTDGADLDVEYRYNG